jgi:hypothetical protein
MSTKPNLSELLAETGGSARQRKREPDKPSPRKEKVAPEQGRGPTAPITLHFPRQVRDQLKILAIEHGKTLHAVGAEAFNDLFAKYGKPEIAPAAVE